MKLKKNVNKQRQLIVFDLDETLVHASMAELGHPAAFAFPPYFVYQRPFAAEMLEQLAANYDLAVWSSSSREYVDAVVAQVFGDRYPIKFAWSIERCVQRVDIKSNSYVYIKDLRKIQGQGYTLDQISIVDDSPEKIARQPRNHVVITPYLGDQNDKALLDIVETFKLRSGTTESITHFPVHGAGEPDS
ncbi:HAD family hydrolase [Undibacterium sp. Ji83W]|uniref:HAD family hydrolase n=1 Tax=Undibacterium sp. Ji83W TaxID=3413043 RepID=UPI003BF0335D